MNSASVYTGNDGELTKRYYALLKLSGPVGDVAVNLFRAQKCSSRAKKYRGGIRGRGSFRGMAYERKEWALRELCKFLAAHPELFAFGWKRDPKMERFGPEWVLYVDLPEGQVSFHSPARFDGQDYAGEWDGLHASESRILAFCDRVTRERLEQRPLLAIAANTEQEAITR